MSLIRLERALRALELFAATCAAIALAATMVIIVIDVFARYFFHSPLIWSMELIAMYLMVIGFYGALSGTFGENAHVRVDLLRGMMSDRVQTICELAVSAPTAFVFGLIAYLAGSRAWVSYMEEEVISGLIAWHVWPSPALVAVGSALITLRLSVNTIAHAVTLVTGRSIVVLPRIVGKSDEAKDID